MLQGYRPCCLMPGLVPECLRRCDVLYAVDPRRKAEDDVESAALIIQKGPA